MPVVAEAFVDVVAIAVVLRVFGGGCHAVAVVAEAFVAADGVLADVAAVAVVLEAFVYVFARRGGG